MLFIPFIPNSKVINKTVVENDQILPLEKFNNDIKITSIKNIDEDYFTTCVKIVLLSNLDTVFDTIQYSKNNKTVYFYANKEIQFNFPKENEFIKYKTLTSEKDMLEEILYLLTNPKYSFNSCISLFNIANLISKFDDEFKRIRREYNIRLNNFIQYKFNKDYTVSILGFDYSQGLKLKIYSLSNKKEVVTFSIDKKDDNIYICEANSTFANNIFEYLYNELYDLYSKLEKFSTINNPRYEKYGIHSINSNFIINITSNSVVITSQNKSNNDFIIFYDKLYDFHNNNVSCDSEEIHNILLKTKDIILKNIFVRIDNCPQWIQPFLHEIRKQELEEERILAIETEKKQKRLKLINKIIPFKKQENNTNN